MVDDHTQRPFRSTEPPARTPATKSPSGNDPLAELARLIGQSDPFGEFGRDGQRRVAAPQPPEPAPEWDAQPAEYAQPAAAPQAPAAHDYYNAPPAQPAPVSNFGRQQFGGAPLAGDTELYQAKTEVPGYPASHASHPGYQEDPYQPGNAHLGPAEDDYYDDVQPSRRRVGILAIAGIFALAVIGTAGAFGYRAVFGSSSTAVPPPVIKADTAPSKIVPAAAKDSQSSKQITDRVNDKGIGEKLVSREEQPVDVKDNPVVVMPQAQGPSGPAAQPNGTGVVGSEPKKVRTIAIRPDQAGSADAPPAPVPSPPARAASIPAAKPAAPQPQRAANTNTADNEPEQPTAAPRLAATQNAPRAAAPSNGPLSLSPDAPARSAPARAAAPPKRTAAATPAQSAPAASSGGGGYAVQVSSQRSEAEAQAAFRSLQAKYPGQLGGKQAMVHRVDLGAKGVYYRAMVGPFATGGEAGELCSGLKAAGGSCIVQKN